MVSAVSVDEAVVSLIEKGLALKFLKCQPELAMEVAHWLSQDHHILLERSAHLAYGSVRKRLARGLSELGESFGVRYEEGLRIDLPRSLRDVAEMIGANPQTTSQELHALAKGRLVKVAWPTLFILDPDGLRHLG
jgi:CRP-like cAMP-binding protein